MPQHRSMLANGEASWAFNRVQTTTADVQNRQSHDKFTDNIIDYENHFVAVSNKYRVILSYWLMLKLQQLHKLLLRILNVSWVLQIHKFVTYFRGLSEREIDSAPEEADSGNRKWHVSLTNVRHHAEQPGAERKPVAPFLLRNITNLFFFFCLKPTN